MFKPLKYDAKDPNETGTYDLDFTPDLDAKRSEIIVGTPTITTSTTAGVASHLTCTAATVNGNFVITTISGGIAGTTCLVTYVITTSLGNIIPRSVILPILLR